MGFSRRERQARFGTGRGQSGWPGVGERGTTLPAPHCSREGGTAPRAGSAALTPSAPEGQGERAAALTAAGWRAVRALLSRVPPRGSRAGGWGTESGWQRGFYGALLLRQEGPWASTLGDSHPPLPAPKWRGAGEGAGAAATRVRASGATHSPVIPPRALTGAAGPGTLRGRQRGAVRRRWTAPKLGRCPPPARTPALLHCPQQRPEQPKSSLYLLRDNQLIWRQGSGYLSPLLREASPGRKRQPRRARLPHAFRGARPSPE